MFEGRLLDLPESLPDGYGTLLPNGPTWTCRFVLDRAWKCDLPDTVRVVGGVKGLGAADIGIRFLVAGNASPRAVRSKVGTDRRADVRVSCGPLLPVGQAEIELLTLDLLSRYLGDEPDTTAFSDAFTEQLLPYLRSIGFSPGAVPEQPDSASLAVRSNRRGYRDAIRDFGWCVGRVSSPRLGALLERLIHESDDPSRVPGVLALVTTAAMEGRAGVSEWLAKLSRHPDPEVRRLVARGLVEHRLTVRDPLLRRSVIERVRDEDPSVGLEALWVYGQSRNLPKQRGAWVSALGAWFDDSDSPLRVPAATVLASWIGAGLGDEQILALLRDRSPAIREAALQSLYKWREIPAPIGLELLTWLNDPNLRPGAVDLLEAVTHNCPELRARVPQWLPKLDEAEASRVVARQFRLCGDDFLGALDQVPLSVAETALEARVLSSSEAFGWQIETGLSSSRPDWRLRALKQSREAWPPEPHLHAIYRCLLDQDPNIQAAAISFLRVFSDPWIEEGIHRLEKIRERQPITAPRVDAVIDSLRSTPGYVESPTPVRR